MYAYLFLIISLILDQSTFHLGFKRKSNSYNAANNSAPQAKKPTLLDIQADSAIELQLFERELDAAVEIIDQSVRDGSYLELQKRAAALQRVKERAIATADRHRKLQIENIHKLYEFEIEDANAFYNVRILLNTTICLLRLTFLHLILLTLTNPI